MTEKAQDLTKASFRTQLEPDVETSLSTGWVCFN